MAITINGFPETHTPVYNNVMFTVISDNIAETNFKYVADVYVGGDVIRLTTTTNLEYNTGIFNIGRVLEAYLSSDIDKTGTQFRQNVNSYVEYYVKFGEEYGATPVVYPGLTTSNTYTAWNGIMDFLKFQEFNATYGQWEYVFRQSFDEAKFLTDRPASGVIRYNEDAWLYANTNSGNDISKARVVTYDVNKNVLQTVEFVNTFFGSSDTPSEFLRFDAGTSNLNNIPSSGITLGAQPIIVSSGTPVAYYTVSAILGSNEYSNTQTYVIDNNCYKNVAYRFHFLNKLGGFDSFTFYRGSNKSSRIKRSNYKKIAGDATSDATYGYNKSSRGHTTYNVDIEDNIKVESDWINEETMDWLEELITSPEVYLDDPTHGLVGIVVNNSKYEFMQDAQGKLFSLMIDFNYSFDRTRQRG